MTSEAKTRANQPTDTAAFDYVIVGAGSAGQRGSTVYHPTSTCRMGTDPLAVVDAR
jgi:choline dehydrogenase-like flavoprotein